MLRFWLWGSIILITNLMMLVFIRTASPVLPFTETYLAIENCQQPCWRGIELGTASEAKFLKQQRLVLNTYKTSIRFSADDVTINEIRLEPHGDIRLGDVMLELGTPTHVRIRHIIHHVLVADQIQRREIRYRAFLYFGDGLIEVEAVQDDSDWFLSPTMVVNRIRYFAPSASGTIIPIGSPEWKGFSVSYPDTGVLH